MVRFLLEAGADQEHKTDEMHTALMEACMVRLAKYIHEICLYTIHRDSASVCEHLFLEFKNLFIIDLL